VPALLARFDLQGGREAARDEAAKESAMKETHMIAVLLLGLLGSADVLAAEGKREPTVDTYHRRREVSC